MTRKNLVVRRALPVATAVLILAGPVSAQARTLCTMVTDARDGRVLIEDGDCRTRVTPASTFKVPLAVTGFDSGVLTDAHEPVLDYRGTPSWPHGPH